MGTLTYTNTHWVGHWPSPTPTGWDTDLHQHPLGGTLTYNKYPLGGTPTYTNTHWVGHWPSPTPTGWDTNLHQHPLGGTLTYNKYPLGGTLTYTYTHWVGHWPVWPGRSLRSGWPRHSWRLMPCSLGSPGLLQSWCVHTPAAGHWRQSGHASLPSPSQQGHLQKSGDKPRWLLNQG